VYYELCKYLILIVCHYDQVDPAPIAQIKFSRPKRGSENNNSINNPSNIAPRQKVTVVSKAEEKEFFDTTLDQKTA